MSIIRGSAPIHEFYIPLEAKDVEAVEIIYHQGDVEIVKDTSKCEISDYLVRTQLSQAETFKFYNGVRSINIQIRVKPFENEPLIGEKITDTVQLFILMCLPKEFYLGQMIESLKIHRLSTLRVLMEKTV